MNELLSPSTVYKISNAFWIWIQDNVLSWTALAQLAALLCALGLAKLLAPPLCRWLDARRFQGRLGGPLHALVQALSRFAFPLSAALLLWFATVAFRHAGLPNDLLRIAVSLNLAWVLIRLVSRLVRNRTLSKTVAIVAWSVAALNILNLLTPTLELLDSMALTAGQIRISLLSVLKAVVALSILLWLGHLVSHTVEQRLRTTTAVTPAMQALISKLVQITLVGAALLVGLGAVGIDLTALAVFSGAVGVGIGFGLQKVVSNFISGIILLLDRSIKPGDVIQLGQTYGKITALNGRYVAVQTRDNTNYLIPNEDLITEQVINWSYTDKLVRLKAPLGVSYDADLRKAIELCLDAVHDVPRALADPKPVCWVKGFGDNSIDIELRFWINDPENGTVNVKGQIYLAIWDRFKEHGIEIPFPQRDIHIRSVPPGVAISQEEKPVTSNRSQAARQMANAGDVDGPDFPDS